MNKYNAIVIPIVTNPIATPALAIPFFPCFREIIPKIIDIIANTVDIIINCIVISERIPVTSDATPSPLPAVCCYSDIIYSPFLYNIPNNCKYYYYHSPYYNMPPFKKFNFLFENKIYSICNI